MHEFTLAQGLMEKVLHLAEEHEAERITKVKVAVSPNAAIVKDSFRFGFEVLSDENKMTKGSQLVIEEPRASVICASCGLNIEGGNGNLHRCPACGETDLLNLGRDDVILLQVEME